MNEFAKRHIATLAILVAFVSMGFTAYVWNAPRTVENKVLEPLAAQVPGLVHEQCPGGWKDTSARDEHIRVLSCTRGPWLVILDQEGRFSYAWDGVSPDFEEDESKVPGW